jgi:hypothetical protein
MPMREKGVALFRPKNLGKGELFMNTKQFVKKSLRFLALLAMTGICQQVDATSLIADDGIDYDTTVPFPSTLANSCATLIVSGAVSAEETWTLNSQADVNIVGQGLLNYLTFGSTSIINAANGANLSLLGNSSISFSAATMNGPTASGSEAILSLYNSPAYASVSGGAIRTVQLPVAAALTGNWTIVSENDASVVDAASDTNPTMPSFTMAANHNVYFGGTRGTSNNAHACYATTFGGSAKSVVTGPGTLILGTAFTTFNPVYKKFTGALEVNSTITAPLALGSTSYPLTLAGNRLLLRGAGPVTLGGNTPAIGTLVPLNDASELITSGSPTGATVSITTLDLTQSNLTLAAASSNTATYNIGQILSGSTHTLTLHSPTASTLNVNIKAGRTGGGILQTGSGTINLTMPTS